MSTLISQLPEEIRKKATKYQKSCKDPDMIKGTDDLWHAFNWNETKEGWSYWHDLAVKNAEIVTVKSQIESIIDRRLSRNETIHLLVKLWEEAK